MRKRVLIVDDDPVVPAVIREILSSHGFSVDTCTDGNSALAMAREHRYDIVLSDLVMPGMNGAELTQELKAIDPSATVLVISGHPRHPLAQEALTAGAVRVVPKPFDIGSLLDFLE